MEQDYYRDHENTTEDDLLQEPDKEQQSKIIAEEWGTSSTSKPEEKPSEDGKAVPAEKPQELTEKQKKKLRMKEKYKNKPKSKSAAQPKPTGFEEFFTEAPITPDEYDYEKDIYHIGRPAIFRLQEALSRYQKKRRLLTERMQVFSQYLRYGGVDVGQKMFGGVSEMEEKAMEKEEVIVARSQTDISIDKMDMKIDFELVIRGFLSFYFPDYYCPDSMNAIKMATDTIKNWLNYLLVHGVVPEYESNILSARKYCDLAETQLWNNKNLLSVTPGDFNKASSFLYGGYYFSKEGQSEQPQTWEGESHTGVEMTHPIALKVVMFALASSGSDEQAARFVELGNRNGLSATPVKDIDGFEIVDILLPNHDVREFYDKQAPDLNPVGKIRAKAWRNPNGPAIDLEPGEVLPKIDDWEFEFFVEETILQHCYLGMKAVTTIWELSCGVFFFDEIMNAYCSFYTAILNDLMLGWKHPRPLTKESEKGGENTGEATADGDDPMEE